MANPQELIDSANSILQRSAASSSIPSPNNNSVDPVPLEVLADEKKKREAASTFGDYAGAVWRQDSPIPGLIASIHGHEFSPVDGYSAIADPEAWKTLTSGISPEYHNEFLDATSPQQAEYIRDRLLQKQNDLTHLGDMGWAGNTARFAAGLVEPTALLAGVASGGTAYLAKGAQLTKTAMAIRGVMSGAATMAGVEKLRQSVNFENNNAQVLEAALIAGAFTAPFAFAGARQAARTATAAMREKEALDILKAAHDGAPVTPEEHAKLAEVQKAADTAAGVENGTLKPDALDAVWAQHEKTQAEIRAKQLDDIHSEGLLRKGDEMQAVSQKLDEVNAATGEQPTAMQLAFQKALGLVREKKEASPLESPLHLQELPPAAPLEHLQGEHVFWHSDEGSGIDNGVVTGETAKGQLIVEHADTGERVLIDRADLHPDSPGYHLEIPAEAKVEAPGFLPKGAAPEPQRVTTSRAGEHVELPPRATQQSRSTAAPESPKGFLPGSIGSAQVGHVPVGETAFNGYVPMLDKLGIKIPMRFDLFAQLNRSPNPVIQKWAQRLIKDPIGSKDGFTQGRTASEEKKLMQRMWEGRTMLAAQDAFKKVREIRKMGPLDAQRFHRQFFELVTAVASGDARAIHANADIAGELQKAAAAYREMYSEMAKLAKETGVKGAEHLVPDDFYVNRSWQIDKIKQAMKAHGEDNVAKLLAHSFNDSAVYGDVTKAKAFLRVILKTEFSSHMQDIHLASRDMHTLRAELGAIDPRTREPRLTDGDIDALVDFLFAKKETAGGDAGNATNLKFRMDLDEAYSQLMPNGETLKVSDLMERDARVLAAKYINSMAGHIAMAKRGIKSREEFESLVAKAAQDYHMDNNMLAPDNGQFAKDLQWLRDIYDNITGRPMSTQVFNNTSRISNAVRAWARSTYLGELGLTAAAEMKQTLALTSLRAVYQQSGSFANLIRVLRSGRIPDSDLARQVEQLWGFGLEHNAAHARQHEFTEFTHDRSLSKLENWANHASHAIDNLSGNSSITSATRQWSAMSFIQSHFDMATGRSELTPSKIKRLAHQGIEDSEVHQVLADLKKYTTADETNGRVESVDWERWHDEHPETYEQYHLAVERETRDAIQDHDLGETIPWGHTQIGKIFLELRTFMAVAHAKNFLKNVHYLDRTSFNVWTYNLAGEALMYALQTSLNYAHDKDSLAKKLTLEKIAQAAVQRASVFGMMPMALSTGYWIGSGGHDLFGQTGTANTDNRNFMVPPSGALLNKAYNTTKTLGGVLNPFSTTVTTNKEFRDAFSLLPGANMYGMRNLNDYISQSFPKHELRQIAP